MPSTTRLVGIVLMVIGILSYLLTGRTSVTALIPAFFGAIFVILAYVARNEAVRRHVMHVAVALGLLGVLGTLGRAIPAVLNGQLAPAGRHRAGRHGPGAGVLRLHGCPVVHRGPPRAQAGVDASPLMIDD